MTIESAASSINNQQLASSPEASAWVSASAGTGKTKVLTDRILRLMLEGVAPQRILCLTFTRAAAAEMANRVKNQLVNWQTVDDIELVKNLGNLTGISPDLPRMTRARSLLERVIRLPGGLRIQTIHSFCDSLLKRFPLEANVAPGFSVMDESTTSHLVDDVLTKLLSQVNHRPSSELGKSLYKVASHTNEVGFRDLAQQVIKHRIRISNLLSTGDAKTATCSMRSVLSINDNDTAENTIIDACKNELFDFSGIVHAAAMMSEGTKTDAFRASVITSWIDKSPKERVLAFEEYNRAFLNNNGKPLARLVGKTVRLSKPEVLKTLKREQIRVFNTIDKCKKLNLLEVTASLLTVSAAILRGYEEAKTVHNKLDFDDLILKSKSLFETPDVTPWVLYKLDGGIDHILIDEAQDTNPHQWDVIQALSEEFFSGTTAKTEHRTIFSVGDPKQSIYSFQQVDPAAFWEMQTVFRTKAKGALSRWNEVGLDISYRSSPVILEAINLVFTHTAAGRGVRTMGESMTQIKAARAGHAGLVEVWPLIEGKPADKMPAWDTAAGKTETSAAHERLALLITKKISILCSSGNPLPNGHAIRPQDIMILVRRRSAFATTLVKELRTQGIPVSGLDPIALTKHIAVMDLISLARFLLMPDDDLSLAEVLKSPLFELDDDDLFAISQHRQGSLWCALRNHSNERLVYRNAQAFLDQLIRRAETATPYELFAELLSVHGGRAAFLSRIGDDATEPLNEFLSQALTHQKAHVPSLQGFLDWLEHEKHAMNRDVNTTSGNAVRILTVHGAKGLEAPIVFLPDTVQTPQEVPQLLWSEDYNYLLWTPNKRLADNVAENLIERAATLRDLEYHRLLYVAMTRAENYLYICGWKNHKSLNPGSWYNLIRTGIKARASIEKDSFLSTQNLAPNSNVLRLAASKFEKTFKRQSLRKPEQLPSLPVWARTTATAQNLSPRVFTSRLPTVPDRREIVIVDSTGALVSKLLQWLPDYPAHKRPEQARSFLADPSLQLSHNRRKEIELSALKILTAPSLNIIFVPESRGAVKISGNFTRAGVHYKFSDTIDRLVVKDEGILLVNFIPGSDSPTDASNIRHRALMEMAASQVLVKQIYSDRLIECAFLLLREPKLEQLPSSELEKWLP